MWIRLTVDTDLVVHDVEACTDHGPYSICGSIVASFQALKGLAIKAGWTLKTRELLGGTRGCTHLVELLGPIATTAFQTVYPARIKREKERAPDSPAGSDQYLSRVRRGRADREKALAAGFSSARK